MALPDAMVISESVSVPAEIGTAYWLAYTARQPITGREYPELVLSHNQYQSVYN